MPNGVYRIEYKDDLNAAAWTTLGNDQMAAGWGDSTSVDWGGTPRRFYRVLLLP